MYQTPNLEEQGTVLAGHSPENQSGLVEPARRPILKAPSGIALVEAALQFHSTGVLSINIIKNIYIFDTIKKFSQLIDFNYYYYK